MELVLSPMELVLPWLAANWGVSVFTFPSPTATPLHPVTPMPPPHLLLLECMLGRYTGYIHLWEQSYWVLGGGGSA